MTKARALFFKMHFHRGTKAAAPSASATASASAATAPLAISTLRFVSFQLVPAAPVAFPFVCNMQHCTQSPVLSAVPPLSLYLPHVCSFKWRTQATLFPAACQTAPLPLPPLDPLLVDSMKIFANTANEFFSTRFFFPILVRLCCCCIHILLLLLCFPLFVVVVDAVVVPVVGCTLFCAFSGIMRCYCNFLACRTY